MEFINWSELPIYCESSSGFFQEPLNAITNLAFLIAAFFIYKKIRKNKIKKPEYYFALFFVISLGLSSFFWHSYGNNLSFGLDFFLAGLFVLTAGFILVNNVIKNRFLTGSIILSFAFVGWILSSFLPSFNAINYYLAGAILLIILLIWMRIKLGKSINKFLIVILILGFSLVLRSIDLAVCNFFPVGTHFLWHLLNALAIYLAIVFLMDLEKK